MSTPNDDEKGSGRLGIFGVGRVRLSGDDAMAELRTDLLRRCTSLSLAAPHERFDGVTSGDGR